MSSFAALHFLRRIFVFIFLSGMMYTVFNYVPIIEEENCKKQEQTSQNDNTDGGGEGGEDETGKTQEGLFHNPLVAHELYGHLSAGFRRYLQNSYIPPLTELNTPPPRQVA